MLVAAKEALIGLLLGLGFGIFIWAIQSVGDLIDFQTGSGNASFFDPVGGHQNGPTGEFLGWLVITLFVSAGGLLAMVRRDRRLVPPVAGRRRSSRTSGKVLEQFAIRQGDTLFLWTVKLAAPVIFVLLLVELGIGLIGRVAPQLNMFVFSQPIKSLLANLMLLLFLYFVYESLQEFLRPENGVLEFLRNTCSQAEKDQKPTPRRLREARKRGEVVFSADVSSAAVFAVVWSRCGCWAADLGLLRELWLHATSAGAAGAGRTSACPSCCATPAGAAVGRAAAAGLAALAGIAGSFFQVGGVDGVGAPQAGRQPAEPGRGLEAHVLHAQPRQPAQDGGQDAAAGGADVRRGARLARHRAQAGPLRARRRSWRSARTCAAGRLRLGRRDLRAMAAVDYVHERHEFMKASACRSRRCAATTRKPRATRSTCAPAHGALRGGVRGPGRPRALASAVIHSARVAVALQYLGERDLPRVIARGEGEVAAQVRRFAAEALVPMEFDAALAGRLYDEVPLDQPIPRALYAPVARLLRWARGQES